MRGSLLRASTHPDHAGLLKVGCTERPAVERISEQFPSGLMTGKTEQRGHTPHFLRNAKMRFGKTFTAYQLARKMGWTKVLVLTFKPAVVHAWSEDLTRHIDFEGWQFITRDGVLTYEQANKKKPIICFGNFQDFLQRTTDGAIKPRRELF